MLEVTQLTLTVLYCTVLYCTVLYCTVTQLTLTCPGVVFTGGGSLAAPAGLFWAAPALGLVFWFAAGAEILPVVTSSVVIKCV